MFAALILAATLALKASDVRSISIDSSWTGLGTPSASHIVLKGKHLNRALVQNLLDALDAPHPASVSAENAGLTKQTLQASAADAEQGLGSVEASDPKIRSAFESIYTDAGAAQTWMTREAAGFHTDDVPKIDVLIDCGNRTVRISSASMHLLMMPFTIAVDNKASDVLDARVAYAIGALLPEKATNRERLQEAWLLGDWAQEVTISDAVQQAKNNGGSRARTALVARKSRMRLLTYNTTDGINWWGDVSLDEQPRVRVEVSCTPDPKKGEDEGACFKLARGAAERVMRVPWVMSALRTQHRGYVWTMYTNAPVGRTQQADWDEHSANADALAYFNAHQVNVGYVRMYPETTNGIVNWSNWDIFDDGTMALESYATGLYGFPFGNDSYDKFPHMSDHENLLQFVGLFVRPDGTWVKGAP